MKLSKLVFILSKDGVSWKENSYQVEEKSKSFKVVDKTIKIQQVNKSTILKPQSNFKNSIAKDREPFFGYFVWFLPGDRTKAFKLLATTFLEDFKKIDSNYKSINQHIQTVKNFI